MCFESHSAKKLLEKPATIQTVEVWIPTLDGRWLILSRRTQPEPEKDVQALRDQIHIHLPPQPPRIKAAAVPAATAAAALG